MAWTSPRTWVSGETVTAALLNTHLRDNQKAIGDAWTSYAPSWTGTTNPAIGNGTIVGAYIEVGKLVIVRAAITMGSTTTYGTGSWSVSLPATVKSGTGRWTLDAGARDSSASLDYPLGGIVAGGGSSVALRYINGSAWGNVTPTQPFTWADTDVLTIHGVYERS